MRILFIHSTALTPASGENIRGNYLIDKLAELHQIDLVTPRCEKQFPGNVRTFLVGDVKRFGKRTELQHIKFGIKAALLRRKLEKRYDVVYCFGLAGTILSFSFAGKNRLICDFYEVDFPELRTASNVIVALILRLARMFHRAIIKKADSVVLLTRRMEEYTRGLTKARTMTVYDAADNEKFNRDTRKEHPEFTVIFHGGILERDNVTTLLSAVRQVAGEINIRVYIVGTGRGLEACRRYVQENPELQDLVTFTGWVDYEEIPAYLARADLGVIPSTKEPLNDYVIPRKAYEYMSSGIVFLMTRLEAATELWCGNEVFFMEEPRAEIIAAIIKQCFHDPVEMERRSARLLEMGERINLQSECEKIIRLIEE